MNIDFARRLLARDTTIHLAASDRGRYVVGGIATATIPEAQRNHPATLARVTALVDGWMGDYPQAETIGSWTDKGLVYLDMGSTVETAEAAYDLAKDRGEIAYWDSYWDSERNDEVRV